MHDDACKASKRQKKVTWMRIGATVFAGIETLNIPRVEDGFKVIALIGAAYGAGRTAAWTALSQPFRSQLVSISCV